MGEVYRAHDAKLGRDVALKVLPDLFADDPERLARFQREARVLASLNHPNIASIYGLEESEGVRALVLELVEGPTLAERIADGALAIDEALPVARQIAEALEAAHAAGVIHRDLKPANVKVKSDGMVKVLDFGLAKALEQERSGDPSESPTMTAAATRAGVIMGTAAYMSPEQAKGKTVDRRADIWAFGCVLYEMLTRQRPFAGDDVSDTLAAVLRAEPAWKKLPARLHPRIRLLLERCLEKDSKDRYHDIADARVDIQRALADPSGVLTQPVAVGAPARGRPILPWVAVTALVSIAITGTVIWNLRPAETPRITRFDYALPEGQRFRNQGRPLLAVSPDGSRFVYNSTEGLYLRSMDEPTARLIPGTEANLVNPFFSPDGQSIGYFSPSGLKRIAISGGAPVTLATVAASFGASWGADDMMVYGQPDGIWQVSASGGTPVRIVEAEEGEAVFGPQILPGGAWVVFTVTTATGRGRWDEGHIVAASLESGERKVLWDGGSDARYVPTGHLVYALADDLFAVPFDVDRLEVTGGAVSTVEGVQRSRTGSTGTAQYAVSDDGSLVYVFRGVVGPAPNTLALVDRNGVVDRLNVPPNFYTHPRLSPDGNRLAVEARSDEGSDIWVYDLSGDTAIRRLTQEGNDTSPIWTPDGERVTFASNRDGTQSIYWQAADGRGVAERLTEAERPQSPESWSPDGRTLSIRGGQSPDMSLWTWSLDGGTEPELFVDIPGVNQSDSVFSPNGQWLGYASGGQGESHIYVQPFPATGEVHQVTLQEGVAWPLWSADGRELFYGRVGLGTPPSLVEVDVRTEGAFTFGTERTLPIGEGSTTFGARNFDITPDGERFLMVLPAGETDSGERARPHINIVQNWFEELKQRVPVP